MKSDSDPGLAARASAAAALLADPDLRHVTVAVTDFQGQLRGKIIAREKVARAAQGSAELRLPLGMLAMDPDDTLLAAPRLTDGADGYADAGVRVIADSARRLPWASAARSVLVLAEYAGDAAPWCPRALLRSVLENAGAQGLNPWYGIELEWTLFEETPWSARDKGYRGLRVATPTSSHGVIARQEGRGGFYDDLLAACATLDIGLESTHEEIGGGLIEAAIAHRPGLQVADDAVLLKSFIKALARRRGQLASFMARWSDSHDGHGAHVHLSLRDTANRAVFHDAGAGRDLSAALLAFIGGVQRWLPETVLLCAPNVNSFKRFVPGSFAPVDLSWGIDNRTCALRVLTGAAPATRIECRVPGADANPYLAVAALVAAGMRGIAEGVAPTAPLRGDAGGREQPDAPQLPHSFDEAVERLRASRFARAAFGDAFVDAYAATRAAQAQALRLRVSDVELMRFFELV
ncbi:MAG: glutamine synthetase [Gammaproteobacteria bacterium]|nr:glutamine synthetase [Gammaproteobacteria bacterium]